MIYWLSIAVVSTIWVLGSVKAQEMTLETSTLEQICPDIETSCPPSCFCYLGRMHTALYVQCQFGNLTHLPQALPECNGKYVQYYLNLSWNDVTFIKGGHSYMDKVVSLDISNNKLRNISSDFFDDKTRLSYKELYLHNNELTSLPRSFRHILEQESLHLTLSGNRWLCECFVVWLNDILEKREHPELNYLACEQKNQTFSFSNYTLVAHCPKQDEYYTLPDYVIAVVCVCGAYVAIASLFAFLYTIRRRVKVAGSNAVI